MMVYVQCLEVGIVGVCLFFLKSEKVQYVGVVIGMLMVVGYLFVYQCGVDDFGYLNWVFFEQNYFVVIGVC